MSGGRENTEELDSEDLSAAALAELDADASSPADGLDADELPPEDPNAAQRSNRPASQPPVGRARPADEPVPSAANVDPEITGPTGTTKPDHRDANVSIHAHADRWHWRRRIRASPHQHRVYRVIIAFVGLFLVALGFVTGPLPGPGGIPLVLLGLAVWASEFKWAHRLMHWFKAQLKRFQAWTRLQQAVFWVIFFSLCGLCGYGYMLVMGIPTWLPRSAGSLLQRLPGL